MRGSVRGTMLTAILLAGCAGGSTVSDGTPPAPVKGKPGAPPATGKSGLTYRPGPSAGYLLERHDSLTLQYPGGAEQQQVRDRVAFLHVTIGESATGSGYPLTIVLDSLHASENGQPVDSAALVKGTRWTGSLGADGSLTGFKSDRGGALPDELTGRLRLFFPRLPPAGVRDGMEWTDSSGYKLVADAFPGTETQVTTYHASESGQPRGITLESAGKYTREGNRQQDEQTLEMTATGERHATHLLGADGRLISAQGHDSGDMTITVPAVGQTVPVKQTGSYSIAPTSAR